MTTTSIVAAQQAGPGSGPLRQPVLLQQPSVDQALLVTRIVLTPAADTVDAGGCRQFTAAAFDAGGRPLSVQGFQFGVSDPARFQADANAGTVCVPGSGPAATTQVTAALGAVSGSATLTVRETLSKFASPSGDTRVLQLTPPPPSVLATTPVPGFTALAVRPFTVELSWRPLFGATGYHILRDDRWITIPAGAVRDRTTLTDVDVPPGRRVYGIAATFRRADGSEGLTEPRALSATSVEVRGLPRPAQLWLARPGGGGSEAAAKHLRGWEMDNLGDWKRLIYPGANEVRAVFFNAGDLAFGRDMRCSAYDGSQWGDPWRITAHADLACYVSNHGPRPGQQGFPNAQVAIADAIAGHAPFATVAMELRRFSARRIIRFRAFDGDGNPVSQVVLDGEGPKPMPVACLSCHGGQYNSETGDVEGASFLPFDVPSFEFSKTDPRYSLAGQADAFRRLNQWVVASRPAPGNTQDLIVDFIAGLNRDGADYVPAAWNKAPGLYRDVVRPYCRTCHLAARPDVIASSDAFLGFKPRVQALTCGIFTMPHAEVPFEKFWTSKNPSAPAVLASALNIHCGG